MTAEAVRRYQICIAFFNFLQIVENYSIDDFTQDNEFSGFNDG